jgi:hypothetical protein
VGRAAWVEASKRFLETFSKVVETIYDCALDQSRWQNTLPQIAKLCRGHATSLDIP